jgi:hypothetical protein
MSEIRVKLTVGNKFGKLEYIATPICPQGEALLEKVKKAVDYKMIEGGKDRKSFAPEWIPLCQDSGFKFVVDKLPELKQYKVGEDFQPRSKITL